MWDISNALQGFVGLYIFKQICSNFNGKIFFSYLHQSKQLSRPRKRVFMKVRVIIKPQPPAREWPVGHADTSYTSLALLIGKLVGFFLMWSNRKKEGADSLLCILISTWLKVVKINCGMHSVFCLWFLDGVGSPVMFLLFRFTHIPVAQSVFQCWGHLLLLPPASISNQRRQDCFVME